VAVKKMFLYLNVFLQPHMPQVLISEHIYEKRYKDKTPKERKKKINDHLPLRAKFQINKLTQEIDQIINPGN